jgi:S1-C subfamily serine protease
MRPRSYAVLFLTLTLAGGRAVHAGDALTAVSGGQCPEGHPETGDIGITSLICVSGSCSVNQQSGRGYTHEFSTEPRIGGVNPDGPAGGKLRPGDAIIAIDGVLITTREGGRRLANLKPGVPVTLRIRRAGKERDVTLVPRLGCNMPRLAVRSGKRPEPWPVEDSSAVQKAWPAAEAQPGARPAAPPFSFGLELECGPCGWRSDPWGALFWISQVPPTVRSVEPGGPGDLAGLEPGDVLLEIDGLSLSGAASGRALGKLRPGEPVELRFRRGRETRTVPITPEAAPRNQRF